MAAVNIPINYQLPFSFSDYGLRYLDLSLRVINTYIEGILPKVLSSRGGIFLFFLRLYRRRVAWKCLIAKFTFPAR